MLAWVAACGAAPAKIDVPAEAAGDALIAFASQAGVEVLFSFDELQKVRTRAVAGAYEPADALNQLLAGTGFSATESAAGKFVVASVRGKYDSASGNRGLSPAVAQPAHPAAPGILRPPAAGGAESQPGEETVRLSKVVVTGSYIPTAADATDVPVSIVGNKDISQTGLNANLLDILRTRIPAFEGRSNTGNSNATNRNQFTAGGSQITLRNLDTLVLINGRRVATSGINAANGRNFVDVNLIPTAAIDHIEVLTDGASAIYGSDAVGGVVNIILKSDYQGVEVGGRYAVSSNAGHYTEKSGYLVAGAADKGVSVTVTGSTSQTDPLWQSQRPFISDNPRSGAALPGFVGGNFLSPALNTPAQTNPTGTAATTAGINGLIANGTYVAAGSASIPAFNSASHQTLLLQQRQRAASAVVSGDIVPKKLVFFGDALVAQTNGFDQDSNFLGNLAGTGSTISGQFPIAAVPAGSPYNPTNAAVSGVQVGAFDTPVYNLFTSKGQRATAGFRGDFSEDWNWEIGATYSDNKTEMDIANELFAPNLNAAIAGGYDASGNAMAGGAYSRVATTGSFYTGNPIYVIQPALDPFARAERNPASLANVYGTEQVNTESRLESYDAKIVGTPVSLPAGKLGFATGFAWRKEELIGTPDQNSYNLSTAPLEHNWGSAGLFFDPFARSHTIGAFFAELRLPVFGGGAGVPGMHALDVSVAGRNERYSDVGVSRAPKFGFRWQPVDDQFTVRGTYSKAFTVPDLFHEYGPAFATLASGNSFLMGNVLSPSGAANSALNGLAYFSGNGNNPLLQPSKAWSRSLGVVMSPKALKGFTLDLDYVNVFYKGIPAGLGASTIIQSVNALGSASPFFPQVALGALPGSPGASTAALAAPYGLYNLLASGSYQNNLYILDHFVNSGGLHEEALDFSPSYEIRTPAAGTFTVSSMGTYLHSFMYAQLPNAPFYEYAGYATNGQTESGTFPHYSFYTSVDWAHGSYDVLVGNQYMSSMTDVPSGQIPAVYLGTHAPTTVNYYTAWDLQLSYDVDKKMAGRLWSYLKGMTFTLGVNNVFNRFGPYAPLSQAASLNNSNVDTAAYSPIGRLLYFSARARF